MRCVDLDVMGLQKPACIVHNMHARAQYRRGPPSSGAGLPLAALPQIEPPPPPGGGGVVFLRELAKLLSSEADQKGRCFTCTRARHNVKVPS